mgnify:FL=1
MLASGREAILKKLTQDEQGAADVSAGITYVRDHARLVDEFFTLRLAETAGKKSSKRPFSLVAVGGYGRKELCPHSDIDILIVSPKSIPAEALDIAQPLFLPLWDLGYDLGHGFRTIRDCLDLAGKDFQVLASLLDVRHIAGDPEVTHELCRKLTAKVLKSKQRKFLGWLKESLHGGRARNDRPHGVLEPNLKTGAGGLRDCHGLRWLAMLEDEVRHWPWPHESDPLGGGLEASGVLSGQDADEVHRSLEWLLITRCLLHHVSGRKNDLLHLELQPHIASLAGFPDRGGEQGVETFLARLHRVMDDQRSLADAVWLSYTPSRPKKSLPEPEMVAPGIVLRGEELDFADPHGLDKDPLAVIRLFWAMARLAAQSKETHVSLGARRAVARVLPELGKALGEKKHKQEAVSLFMELLSSGSAYPALGCMLDMRVLSLVVPALGRVRDMVQFDGYHTFPVGRHSVESVGRMEALARVMEQDSEGRVKFLAELWAGVLDKKSLLLAALLHDVGKGGQDHELRGADLAVALLREWDVDEQIVKEVDFLVRNHLFLILTAIRSDLNDESVAIRAAAQVKSRELLDKLLLLTQADARATGPKAWNDWNMHLLMELHAKTRSMLDSRLLPDAHSAQRILANRDKVRSLAKGEFVDQDLETWLGAMPSRYTLQVPAKEILAHLELVRDMERDAEDEARRAVGGKPPAPGVAIRGQEKAQGVWEVVIAASNRPALFTVLTGVLSLHGLNIHSGDTYVWNSGVLLAVFRTSPPPDPDQAGEFWARVRGSVRYALSGKLALEYRLDAKRSSLLAPQEAQIAFSPRVKVDNTSSEDSTLIEVKAMDRIGLLHDIASTLDGLQLTVHAAKAATEGGRAMDLFSVLDPGGAKVEDPAQCAEIEQALQHRLSAF